MRCNQIKSRHFIACDYNEWFFSSGVLECALQHPTKRRRRDWDDGFTKKCALGSWIAFFLSISLMLTPCMLIIPSSSSSYYGNQIHKNHHQTENEMGIQVYIHDAQPKDDHHHQIIIILTNKISISKEHDSF